MRPATRHQTLGTIAESVPLLLQLIRLQRLLVFLGPVHSNVIEEGGGGWPMRASRGPLILGYRT